MIFQKNIIKQFFVAVLGISLIFPFFAFALEDEGFNLGELQEIEAISAGSGGGILSFTLGGQLVPTELPLGTIRDTANSIAWKVAKLLVHSLTQQIVQLIRTGGQGGSPLFVTNWQDFLLNAADQASGVFLEELKLTALCQPFGPRLRLIFAGGRRPFHERARCTVSGALRNIESFYQDFSSGGWQRWIEISQIPANNPYEAYLLTQEEKERRTAIAVTASLNQAKAGSGFLNIEECKDVETVIPAEDPTQPSQTLKVPVCDTVSPGKWLEQRIAKATNADIDQLNLADSFNEILFAAFETLMRTLFFQPGGLRSSNISTITTTQDLATLKADGLRISGIDSAIAATKANISLKQNSLAKVEDTIKTLQSLKTCQQNKNEPIATTNNRIATVSTTAATLRSDIIDQTILLETLKDDRQAIILSQTVAQFQAALQKTQKDVRGVTNQDLVRLENDQITQTKSQAEADLQNCLNPPSGV